MKTATVILCLLFASCSSLQIPQTKLEQEAMRLKEERKFNRRHATQNEIRLVHISLFTGFALMLWYEAALND